MHDEHSQAPPDVEQIRRFVHAFYERVRADAALGPITTMIAFNTLILLPATILLVEIARGRRDRKSAARIALARVRDDTW